MRAASLLFLSFLIALALAGEQLSFKNWMQKHNKNYFGTEAIKRFQIYKENLNKIEELNKRYPGVTFGANKFADLTTEEFKAYYLSSTPMIPDPSWPVATVSEEEVRDIPDSYDWRDQGAVTGVKDQGQCGSCWSFSTTGNVEGQWFLSGHELVGLSEQNLVDCDHTCTDGSCDSGCDGGLMSNAFQFIIKNGGIDSEESYPYEGVDSTCRFNSKNVAATISNWTMISGDEGQMAAYLVAHGPVSIAVDAEAWQFYIEGVFYLPCGTSLDHGVLLVGYGTETDIFFEQMPFWTIKNSWGEDWGESGYIRIERGTGKCGVNLFPCSSIIA